MHKLSDLIRAAGKQFQPVYDQFVDFDEDGNICAACALGGAALVAGMPINFLYTDSVTNNPIDFLTTVTGVDMRAVLPGEMTPVWQIIANKYDRGESSDQIAAWLDSFTALPTVAIPSAANPADMDRLWED
jgi:hypothetical protein